MKKSKKGIEAAWNTVIYALLAVILILAIWFIFKSGTGKGLANIITIGDDAKNQALGNKCKVFFSGNYCLKEGECKEGYDSRSGFNDCDGKNCCVKNDIPQS